MRIVLIWCVLVLSAWCVPGWSSLQTPNFSAQFPKTPEQSQSQQDTLIGPVKTYLYCSALDQFCYSLASTEIPTAALLFASGSVVDDAKKALLADCSGQELSWQELRRYSGGRELSYRYPDGQGRAQFFLISGRLYVLDMRTKASADLTSASVFFDSFQPAPLARK